ncbi:hypothetical protein LguiB_026771 [Lonicera macranthoides]
MRIHVNDHLQWRRTEDAGICAGYIQLKGSTRQQCIHRCFVAYSGTQVTEAACDSANRCLFCYVQVEGYIEVFDRIHGENPNLEFPHQRKWSYISSSEVIRDSSKSLLLAGCWFKESNFGIQVAELKQRLRAFWRLAGWPQTQDIHSLVYDKQVIFHFLIRNGNRLLHRLAYTTLFSSVSEIWDFVLS